MTTACRLYNYQVAKDAYFFQKDRTDGFEAIRVTAVVERPEEFGIAQDELLPVHEDLAQLVFCSDRAQRVVKHLPRFRYFRNKLGGIRASNIFFSVAEWMGKCEQYEYLYD